MRDVFFNEIRRNVQLIADDVKKNGKENDKALYYRHYFCETIDLLIELSNIARREGLLTLEEAAYHLSWKKEPEKHLKRMILLVVDGTDPEVLEEICGGTYFSNCFDGYEGMVYLLYIYGIMAIQAGENPRAIEGRLFSLLPEFLKPYSQDYKLYYYDE
ncbi:MAG: hypothetical protein K6E85_17040 [Lachnospiraceae bacterium]|nr:hypothetical protein [Lachnospiraceae bacterium]